MTHFFNNTNQHIRSQMWLLLINNFFRCAGSYETLQYLMITSVRIFYQRVQLSVGKGAGKLRYGAGTNLNGGPVDCSGFVLAVFRQFGISLPRTSAEQCAAAPRYVSEAEMLPGDLIFYGNGGRVNHVAIYTGENSIVHATNSSRGWVFEDSGSSAMHYAPIIAIGRYW